MKKTYSFSLIEIGSLIATHLVKQGEIKSVGEIQSIQLAIHLVDSDSPHDTRVVDAAVTLKAPT